MAASSGKFAKVQADGSTLIECTGWTWSLSVAEHAYASCQTSQYKKRVAGTGDSSGEVRGVFDPADPIQDYILPGDAVTLKLYFTATRFHSVPVMIINIDTEVDIEEGEIIRWTATFGGNGVPTLNQTD